MPPSPPSFPPPPSTPTAPALERPDEPADVARELREMRYALSQLPEMRREMSLMRASIGHLADSRSVDRLLIGRVDRVLTKLARHLGVKVEQENGRPEEKHG